MHIIGLERLPSRMHCGHSGVLFNMQMCFITAAMKQVFLRTWPVFFAEGEHK